METYSFLRELADSWALLVMFSIFIGIGLWAFRPGSRAIHDDTANIPFRHDDRPAPLRGDDKSLAPVSGDPAAN